MKKLLILLAAVVLGSLAQAADTAKFDQFKAKLTDAITRRDTKSLMDLFCVKDASQYQIDISVSSYGAYWDKYVLDKIEVSSVDDPSFNPAFVKNAVNGATMNGHKYVPNAPVIGICSVTFKSADGKTSTGIGSAVGTAPDGSICFPMQVRVSPDAKP